MQLLPVLCVLVLSLRIYLYHSVVDRPDVRRRMLANMIMAGGYGKSTGLVGLLEERVFEKLPTDTEVERIEVLQNPKEKDPQVLCWRGAAVLAQLDGASELWIRQRSWRIAGERAVLDRATFNWHE